MRKLVIALTMPLFVATGCSEINDRIDGSINSIASKALADGVRDKLAEAGIELDSDPDCSTDFTRDGASLTGSATCDGTTVEGVDATATFNGTLSTSGCTGSITIVIEGRTVVDDAEVPNCSVNL